MRNMILSTSSLDTLQSCSVKFKYVKIDKIVPVAKSAPLEKGSLIHKLLEDYYRAMMLESIAGTFTPARIPFIAKNAIDSARIYADSLELSVAESEDVINYFKLYLVKYKNDNWSPVGVEVPFSRLLFESAELDLRVYLEGKIDLIVKNQNTVLVVDHKSSSKNSFPNKLSNQFLGYCWAFDVKSVVRNNIVYVKDPDKQFSRAVISYTSSNIAEWLANTVQSALELDRRVQSNNWTRSYSSCKFCDYSELCETDPESRDWRTSQNFREATPHDIFTPEERAKIEEEKR